MSFRWLPLMGSLLIASVINGAEVRIAGCPPLDNPFGLEDRHVVLEFLQAHGVAMPPGASDEVVADRYRAYWAAQNAPAPTSVAPETISHPVQEDDRAERINLEVEIKRRFGVRPDPAATIADLREQLGRLRAETPDAAPATPAAKPVVDACPEQVSPSPIVGSAPVPPTSMDKPHGVTFDTPEPVGRPVMTRREFIGAFLNKRTYVLIERYGEPDKIESGESTRGWRWERWYYRKITTTPDIKGTDTYVWLTVKDKVITSISFHSW